LLRQDVQTAGRVIGDACCAAGSIITDKRLTEALVSYWQHDALLQLLLHAVRVLMQHAALLQTGQAQQQQQEAQQPSEEQPGDEQAAVQEAADTAAVKRSVGLPELLSAVQDLGKVGGKLPRVCCICE
jgi:heme exporter protein D